MNTTICLNEDCTNFFWSFSESEMTEEGLRKHARFNASGQVSRVIYNTNAQRSPVASNVMQPFWDEIDFHDDGTAFFRGQKLNDIMANGIRNTQYLHDRKIDPYKIWIDETKKCGREAWLSIRTNDLHMADDENSNMHSHFWRNHPEYRIMTDGASLWFDHACDYARKEVRDYYLDYLQELLDNYDMDGIELDWSRFPQQLRYGYEILDAHFITDFVRAARTKINAAARRRGHAIKLGARLPSQPELARRHGFEFTVWRDEHLVDVICVTNFWGTTDSDMPLELWRDLLGHEIELDAGFEILVKASPNGGEMIANREIDYGFAAQFLYRGADRIYLFNHMRGATGFHDDTSTEILLKTAGDTSTVYPLPRRHIVTFCTMNSIPLAKTVLPCPVDNGIFWQIRINVGGGTCGHSATVILGFRDEDGNFPLELRLNNMPCTEIDVPEIDSGDNFEALLNGQWRDYSKTGIRTKMTFPKSIRNLRRFQIPDGALHDGENAIMIRVKDETKAEVVWAEIDL